MARLKLPDGSKVVAHGQFTFTADEAGCIDTQDAPAAVVEALIAHAGARPATDEDDAAADREVVAAQVAAEVEHTKEALVAKLKEFGMTADGRKSVLWLRSRVAEFEAAKLEADKAAEKAAKKAADDAAKTETEQAKAAAAAAKAATDKAAADAAEAAKAEAEKGAGAA